MDIDNLKKEINHHRKLRIQTDMSHGKLVELLQDYRSKIEIMLSESTYLLEQRETLIQTKENLERMNIAEQQSMQAEYDAMVGEWLIDWHSDDDWLIYQGSYIVQQNDTLEAMLIRERKGNNHETRPTFWLIS